MRYKIFINFFIFPCTDLDFAYTAHLKSTVSQIAGVSGTLINAGFSFDTYYRKTVNANGTFSLYY